MQSTAESRMVDEPEIASDEEAADKDCLLRAARGDIEAIGALYDRRARGLLHLAARIVRTRSEAEDIVHDVFVAVYDRASRYRPELGSEIAMKQGVPLGTIKSRAARVMRQLRLTLAGRRVPDRVGMGPHPSRA